MRISRTALVAGGALLLVAGAAEAADIAYHRLDVDLPDGGVAHIDYAGNVAPKVTFEDAATDGDNGDADADAPIPFVDLARFDRAMEAQQAAMMQQVAEIQKLASATTSGAPGVVLASDLPAGVHFTMVSSTTDANGCTQTVEYRSDGSSAAPKMTKVSAGSCDKATVDPAKPVQAKATKPAPADQPQVGEKV